LAWFMAYNSLPKTILKSLWENEKKKKQKKKTSETSTEKGGAH